MMKPEDMDDLKIKIILSVKPDHTHTNVLHLNILVEFLGKEQDMLLP